MILRVDLFRVEVDRRLAIEPRRVRKCSRYFEIFAGLVSRFARPDVVRFQIYVVSLGTSVVDDLADGGPVLSVLSIVARVFRAHVVRLRRVVSGDDFLDQVFLNVSFPIRSPRAVRMSVLVDSQAFNVDLVPRFVDVLRVPYFNVESGWTSVNGAACTVFAEARQDADVRAFLYVDSRQRRETSRDRWWCFSLRVCFCWD